jgi:hypothetical protein
VSGQVQPRAERPSRAPKIFLAVVVIAALIGGGIGFAIYRSSRAGDEEVAARSPSNDGDDPPSNPPDPDQPAKLATSGDRPSDKTGDGDPDGKRAEDPTTIASGTTITGPVRIIKPGMTEEPTPDGKAWDVSGYIPSAAAKAKAVFPDAVLARIDAEGVYPSGTADLTLDDSFYVLYRFQSPSRAARPKDLPLGVEHKPSCLYYVYVTAETIMSYIVDGFACDMKPISLPRCTAQQVWKKAAAKGAPTNNAVGSLGLWAADNGEARWLFQVADRHSAFYPDDC